MKWWRPTFTGNRWSMEGNRRYKQAFSWSVPEPAESECPVSAITPRSHDLVQIVSMLKVTQSSTGSAISAGELPGSILDAIRICEYESRTIEDARDEAASQ